MSEVNKDIMDTPIKTRFQISGGPSVYLTEGFGGRWARLDVRDVCRKPAKMAVESIPSLIELLQAVQSHLNPAPLSTQAERDRELAEDLSDEQRLLARKASEMGDGISWELRAGLMNLVMEWSTVLSEKNSNLEMQADIAIRYPRLSRALDLLVAEMEKP